MKRLAPLLLSLPLLWAPALANAAKKKGHPVKIVKRGKKAKRRTYEKPVPLYVKGGMPNIQAQSAVVVELATGAELYQKNPDELRPIASISKLMAMMVVLDHKLDLDQSTTILDDDRRLALHGARSRLPVGATLSNRDLLHAALMASDNRAVPALGRAVGLDPIQFTLAMNQKARALGLPHTSFGDPTGLNEQNRSTPREVAKMLAAAIKMPLIAQITRKGQYVAHAFTAKRKWPIEYTNTDVYTRGKRYTVLGGKTGYTDLAGYCLAIAARLDGAREVAMVFLGAHGKMTRFADFARAAQWIAEKKPRPSASPTPPAVPDTRQGALGPINTRGSATAASIPGKL